jgi:hypothetical protein
MKPSNEVRSLKRKLKTANERLEICEKLIDILRITMDLEGKPGDVASLASSLGKKRVEKPASPS